MADAGRKLRIKWKAAPTVEVVVEYSACPYDDCDGERFSHVRGLEPNGDNSATEQVVCSTCQRPYQITRRQKFRHPADCVTWPE